MTKTKANTNKKLSSLLGPTDTTALPMLTAILLTAGLINVAIGQSPPKSSYPYSTTMLRTHHYPPPKVFLSIGEELSSYQDKDGSVWQATNIVTGWPYSIRDEAGTTILGIRVVYRYDADPTIATEYDEWYYMTDLDGVETCISYTSGKFNKQITTYLGTSTIRGIEAEGWLQTDSVTMNNITTWYSPDVEGMYPFRTKTDYADQQSEIGWILDQGTHFVGTTMPWFNTSGCDASKQHPWSHLTWAKEPARTPVQGMYPDAWGHFKHEGISLN